MRGSGAGGGENAQLARLQEIVEGEDRAVRRGPADVRMIDEHEIVLAGGRDVVAEGGQRPGDDLQALAGAPLPGTAARRQRAGGTRVVPGQDAQGHGATAG